MATRDEREHGDQSDCIRDDECAMLSRLPVRDDRDRQCERKHGELRSSGDRHTDRDDREHVTSGRRASQRRMECEHRPDERRIRDDFGEEKGREHDPRHDHGHERGHGGPGG